MTNYSLATIIVYTYPVFFDAGGRVGGSCCGNCKGSDAFRSGILQIWAGLAINSPGEIVLFPRPVSLRVPGHAHSRYFNRRHDRQSLF